MRIINTKNSVAANQTIPFEGLGIAMDDVQATAQTMKVIHHIDVGRGEETTFVPELVVQPSGYSLLVALGREIRGR